MCDEGRSQYLIVAFVVSAIITLSLFLCIMLLPTDVINKTLILTLVGLISSAIAFHIERIANK